ncbi:hypothetical protein [Ammoniphilus sp. 3BR4]|uniref:hypothetical protein n=1 Tax=Ammoniphilus sp. 3BR4 TaxID=3158265 RepID=UPI003466F1EF
MVVMLEGTGQILMDEVNTDRMMPLLEEMLHLREKQVRGLVEKVEQYENKRNAEERVYQSMGPFRRLLAAKRPEHHLAVEYMVYVKRPLQEINDIQADMKRIEKWITEVRQETDKLFVPLHLSYELEKNYRKFLSIEEG